MKLFVDFVSTLRLRFAHRAFKSSSKNHPEKTTVSRDLTVSYGVALSLVAGLSVGTHILLDRVIQQNTYSATVINIAGRQRTLSQRIGLYSKAVMNGDLTAKGELTRLVDLMERSHFALIHRNGEFGLIGELSPKAAAIYFKPPHALDKRTQQFVTHTRTLLSSKDLQERQSSLEYIRMGAMTELLDPLDRVVSQFETEANSRIISLRQAQKMVLVVLLMTLGLEAFLIFKPLVLRVQSATDLLLTMAMRDELTGLLNRRYFVEMSEREISLALRENVPMTLLMADIDHFKKINDTYGHAVGDEVITTFADTVSNTLRQTDIVARIGGEEFAIVLVNSNQNNAISVAERIREAIENSRIEGYPQLKWTTSIGLAELSCNNQGLSQLMQQADQALYAAKNHGRNQVCVFSEEMTASAEAVLTQITEVDYQQLIA